LSSGNLLLVLGQFMDALFRGRNAIGAAWALVRDYALFHGILAVTCIVWATLRVRAVALRQAFGRTRRVSAAGRHRPAVGDNAMLWKELYIEGGLRFNIPAAILVALLVVATFLPALIILVNYMDYGGPWQTELRRAMNGWVRGVGTLAGCLMLLGVAIRASSSIGAERDKQTYDALLTSPLDSNAILFAKWLGSILSPRLAWAWVGLIWFLGLVTGGLHFLAVPLLVVAWLVYASFYAMLGLWFSMNSATTMRATVWTMGWSVILGGGHMLCWLPLQCAGGGRAGEGLFQFQMSLMPPAGLSLFAFVPEDFHHPYRDNEVIRILSSALVGIFLWALASAIFWFGILSPRYRRLTGREDVRSPEDPGYQPRMRRARRTSRAPPTAEVVDEESDFDRRHRAEDWRYRAEEDSE
jgi:hypothetical protein